MTSPNKAHQSGHVRAFIDTDPLGMSNVLYVVHEQDIIQFSSAGALVVRTAPDAVSLSNGDALMAWDDLHEDMIVDMWKAIGKALDVYSDEPSLSYKLGYAEGKAEVMEQWKNELKGLLEQTAAGLLQEQFRDDK